MNTYAWSNRSPARVAALFGDAESAYKAVSRLMTETDLSNEQVLVVDPQDPLVKNSSEPDTRGVGRILLRSHLTLALLGLLIGLASALVLTSAGVLINDARPMMISVTFGAFGAILGLLVAGLMTARPDHRRLNIASIKGVRVGHWMVVALAADREQRERARSVLARRADVV